MYLRNGKVGVFDLSSGTLEEHELSDQDNLNSLKVAERISVDYGYDPLVLGTGVLTASFVPAACAGFVMAKRVFMPILGFAGMELKLSGFDFLVVNGRSEKRGYLWIRDGMVEFVESEDIASLDSWKRTDKIRADQGDGKIQVLSVGPWGDSSRHASQIVIDYWGGEDKVGMGAEFGKRNLGAIAFRGMGELEINELERHFEDALLLMSDHIQRLGANKGLASYSDVASRDDFSKLFHRTVACYGCPYPCRSFLKVFEAPNEFRLLAKEPGYLHYDVPALAKAFASGLDSKDATIAMIKCARAGAEPVSVLSSASPAGLEAVDAILSKQTDIMNMRAANFESSFTNLDDYRSAVGLGICPRYWSKVGFDFEAVASYAQSALDLKPA